MFMTPMPPTSSDSAAMPAEQDGQRLAHRGGGGQQRLLAGDREVGAESRSREWRSSRIALRPPGRRPTASRVDWSPRRRSSAPRCGVVPPKIRLGRGASAARSPGRPGWCVESEPGRGEHADHGERDAVDRHRLPDRVGAPNSSLRRRRSRARRPRPRRVVGGRSRNRPWSEAAGRAPAARPAWCRPPWSSSWSSPRSAPPTLVCDRGDRRRCPARPPSRPAPSRRSTVRVDAEPKPPRTPAVLVELPGETISRLLPSALICAADLLLRALARARR